MDYREEYFSLALPAVHPIFVSSYASIIASAHPLSGSPITAAIWTLVWDIRSAVHTVKMFSVRAVSIWHLLTLRSRRDRR